APRDIELVSVSTTLATNALVEGRIARVGLILIGFPAAVRDRPELCKAISDGPVISIAGGHDAHGNITAQLDLAGLDAALDQLEAERNSAGHSAPSVDAFAVAGMFAVRNTAHEQNVRARLRARFGVPVTCSHELSAALDAPRRALTAVLNAQLVGLIDGLIAAVQRHLQELGIDAPLMIVRGDGALMAADVARERPIETILSGPAASCIGAAYLGGVGTALVSDIGGTTTDIAILENGVPMLAATGARVGGWQTMVRAVGMHTVGLGGDSAVRVVNDGLSWSLTLGPQRQLPLSLAAMDHGPVIMRSLRQQLARDRPGEHDGLFIMPTGAADNTDDALIARLAALKAPLPLADAVSSRRELPRIWAAVARGHVRIAGVTPSDASHVLGTHTAWSQEAATLGLEVLAKRRDARGDAVAPDAATMAARVVDTLHRRSAQEIMDVALAEDGLPAHSDGAAAAVYAAARTGHAGHVAMNMALRTPIIAVGASDTVYYPQIAAHLSSEAIVPEHADVANAVGAVVSPVRVAVTIEVTSPAADVFRFQDDSGVHDFKTSQEALDEARAAAERAGLAKALAAGAAEPTVTVSETINTASVEGATLFVGATITAQSVGRPQPRAAPS
ncbi:MAG: hydantoinase/oxoprolinase family protein, partial [Pseudomonadota bacterium]